MKVFKKKEEKNKVGRPKLADMDTKKKSIIMCAISLLLVIILLSRGLVSLNILPNFDRLKGEVNTSLCSEIPAKFRPRSESNPEGLHEYGFTDPKFYSAVVSNYNNDSTYCGTITEKQLASRFGLVAYSSGLTNVDGLQYLTGLTYLYLYNNNLSSIDVSHNTALEQLSLDNNNLSSIDLSGNTALTSLNLSSNKLSSIDLSHNTALTGLYLYNNNLSSIDLSHNTALTSFGLSSNNLSSIDVSHNTALTYLYLSSNKLSSIDLSHNTALTDLQLSSNKLSSIDVSHNTALTFLELYSNLSSIDLSHNTALTTLYLRNNNLSSIDLSGSTALTTLVLSNNNLSSIDLSHNTALTNLNLANNNLSSIDLSHNTALTGLSLANNNLSSIDLSHNTSLKNLYLSGNPIYKTYSSTESSITLDSPNIITSYPNDTTYSIDNTSIATYENGVVKRVAPGSTTLNIKYKISESREYTVNHTINFIDITSSRYTIDNENKTIDLNNGVLEKVGTWEFNIEPYGYNLNINGDKLEIKDNNGTVVDTYKFKNYVLYKLTSHNYVINEENKTIDLNNGILEKVVTWEFNIEPYGYNLNINGDKLEIKDNNGTVVDTYQMINMRSKVSNAYKKAGFKDKNFYSCIVNKEYEDYLLTEEELKGNSWISCSDSEIEDVTGIEKLTNLYNLDLSNNNLSSIDLSHNTSLRYLVLTNNNLSNIDLSKLENLENVSLDNNKLEEVILPNNSNLKTALLHNNNLKSIDLSNSPNLYGITLQNNPLTNTIYIIKDGIVDYNNIKLNENIKVNYSIDDSGIASYEDGKLKGLKEGTTLFKMSNENIISVLPEYLDKCSGENYGNNREYCDNVSEEEVMLPYFMSNEIKVYDIKSDVYKIDKEKKTIDVKGTNLDVSKVTITLDGLKGSIDGNYYVIKDENREVDKYKILNPKVVVKETTTTKKEIVSTTKSKKATNTIAKENKDIELSGGIVPNILLQSIKGQDRNIVVKQEGITFIINGKDIESITSNLDLSVEIGNIKESIIKEKVKKELEKAVVLNFKNEGELPGKVLVEVEATDSIKEEVGVKEINVYNYNKDKYNLVAEDLSLNNNKITFYVDKLGYYILTNEKVEDKYVEVDDSMMGENTKLNKEIKQKKIIIPIVIIIIILTLGIVGYVRYKKNIKRHIIELVKKK